ncbi:hypothetical protein D6833_09320 [Candidatus Parcubacteria bacterium]|nr:MAG: hypothetical protein D6833_09320 [Candidatus Parcubacteria bacterium]
MFGGKAAAGLVPVNTNDPEVRRALNLLIELIRTWRGEGRDPLDQVVTLRDLVHETSAVAALRRAGITTGDAKSLAGLLQSGAAHDLTPPPRPTNLVAKGAFASIVLQWEFTGSSAPAYFEIHRANVDDVASAKLIATTRAQVFTDQVGTGKTYYYWVRAVSKADVAGPFNAVAGTKGETADDPSEIISVITQKPWAPNTFFRAFNVVAPSQRVLDASGIELAFQATVSGRSGTTEPNWNAAAFIGGVIVDNEITWQAIEASRAPLVLGDIGGQPVAFLANAVIKDGSIDNAKIANLAVDSAKIAVGAITEVHISNGAVTNEKIGNVIQSQNYVPGVSGWRILRTGEAEFNSLLARGILQGAEIYGGKIEGANIVASALTKPTQAGDPYYTQFNPITSVQTTGSKSYYWYSGRYGKDSAAQEAKWYSPYMDLVPYNHPDTTNYNRFMYSHPHIRVEFELTAQYLLARNAEYDGWIRLLVGGVEVARTWLVWNKGGSYASGAGYVNEQGHTRLLMTMDVNPMFAGTQTMRAEAYFRSWRGEDIPSLNGGLRLIGYSQQGY